MKLLLIGSIILFSFCQNYTTKKTISDISESSVILDSNAYTIASRYHCPDSFYRIKYDSASFQFYLSNLKLKPVGTQVKYFDGSLKSRYAYSSVVDMEISPVDLQQCADAVMRLRGEYLYHTKQFNKISFRFLGDGKMHTFNEYAAGDKSYKKFRKYMDYVFSYANTASLHKQLYPKSFYKMEIGDVFIQKGQPYGHAVIVVDICQNKKGEKKFLLAQSYMPAQETQILLNPNGKGSWYSKPESVKLYTPEWTFDTSDLRTWSPQ